jgi:hypothetical protein
MNSALGSIINGFSGVKNGEKQVGRGTTRTASVQLGHVLSDPKSTA